MSDSPVILWFRQDLRLSDHLALNQALQAGSVIPVYIFDPQAGAPWALGAASRWWLHHSLAALNQALQARGSRLILRQGPAQHCLAELLRETGAVRIFASRLYEPLRAAEDARLQQILPLELWGGSLLFEPGQILTGSNTPFKVFTPFWRACLDSPAPRLPLPAPDSLPPLPAGLESLPLPALDLLPRIPWDQHFPACWQVGEEAAQQRLQAWLQQGLQHYAEERNLPAQPGSSRLSPHLHFGEISPFQVWHAVQGVHLPASAEESRRVYLTEIGWREFAAQILHTFPHTDREPLDPRFRNFPWRDDAAALKAWQQGQTGYPMVDAGMRELWATGWMHNRVRMIVASFLTKDLLLPWQRGAEWFWDTLLDADLAANSLNWQWCAGCGADAAPYFRIFNPVSQGEKFDPAGAYVRHWVPELSRLPDRWLHRPWEAPPLVRLEAGVELGGNYPAPWVDHKQAREAALQAYAQLKKN